MSDADEEPAVDPSSIKLPGEDTWEGVTITDTCSQVRTKINALINSGEMKVTHFQKEIGVSPNSYGSFMRAKGPYGGSGNNTYGAAFIFFKKRELAGVKPPKKKKAKVEDKNKFDVSLPELELDGEDEGEVEVYDTCDVVRTKINAHLREDGVTKAGLCRQLSSMLPDGQSVHASTLDNFLKKKGPNAGASSRVFYAGYVFFEKLRLKENKPKSKFRKEMEDVWGGRGGMDLDDHRHGFIVHASKSVYVDKYGDISVH
jgi:hypothetical protein